ncbi:MAG TPA: DUF5781 family protein [Natrialbaceae archaeon]|nr:DUF5781 family protein [Natrialbaceae archaeon]
MDVRVRGAVPPDPFLSARDVFETEHDLERPVWVEVRADPDERTWTGHHEDHHTLNISRQAATSAMARELALHEYAHMRRHEEAHPSHVQSTEEVLYLALAGRTVERRHIAHCYQIANHMKDVYADDITLSVGPGDKLVDFFESALAAAVADRPGPSPAGDTRLASAGADPDITAVNAAFALAMVERHDLADADHRLYEFARVADGASSVSVDSFRRRFRTLARDPSESTYRKALVDATREYATTGASAAD